MSTRYTVRYHAPFWVVADPSGVELYWFHSSGGYSRTQWHRAVRVAQKYAALDRVRDAKHAALFSGHDEARLPGFFDGLLAAATRQPHQDDYTLAN